LEARKPGSQEGKKSPGNEMEAPAFPSFLASKFKIEHYQRMDGINVRKAGTRAIYLIKTDKLTSQSDKILSKID
jgi:hypothetical protein